MTTSDWVPVIAQPADAPGPKGDPGPRGPAGGERGPKGDPAKAYIGDTPPPAEASYVLWLDTSGDGGDPELGNMVIKGIGNLLTDNQASGGDTLGTTDGFTAVGGTLTYQPSGGVTNGHFRLDTTTTNAYVDTQNVDALPETTYTLTMSVRGTPGTLVYINLVAYGDGAGYISETTDQKFLLTSEWATYSRTWKTPAGTKTVRPRPIRTNVAGAEIDIDHVSFHRGAGGDWAMPGTPIVNLGRRVTHPNTDDVLVEVWDAGLGRWQRTYYDTGVRTLQAETLGNDCTISSNYFRLQRTNNTVMLNLYLICGPTTALGSTNIIYTLPVGFRPRSGFDPRVVAAGPATRPIAVSSGGSLFLSAFNSAGGFPGTPQAGDGETVWISMTYQTDEALPDTLPGTTAIAAPAAGSLDVPDIEE